MSTDFIPTPMQAALLAAVGRRPCATFQDFALEVPGFPGGIAMFNPAKPELFIWHAVSSEGIRALSGLLRHRQIFIHPASNLTYLKACGDLPRLPICRDHLKFEHGIDSPHWFPVVFTIGPHFDPQSIGG